MRYISKILIDGKYADGVMLPNKHKVRAFVGHIDGSSLSGNCIGVLHIDKNTILIRHTAMQAQLYKYIESINQSTLWENFNDIKAVDFIRLGQQKHFSMHERNLRGLEIDAPGMDLMIYSKTWSVVETDINDGKCFMSLFDFLMFLSRQVDANVMSWRAIRINSQHGGMSYNIVFKHDTVADRYFSKIALFGNQEV